MDFPTVRFRGNLRPSQVEVVKIARQQLAGGERRLHVVAPPGSGKTVTGLYLWAECIRVPALVLSPNSAIQAQWAARLDLFDWPGGSHSSVSTDPETPKLFTSLTYQSVTLPRRGGQDLDAETIEVWINRLIEKGQAKDPDEALVWIEDLKRHNRAYYEDRLGGYRKVVRDAVAIGGAAMQTLHASSLETLERLKGAKIGLIILDECHHLMSHWGRVLADAHRYFDHPIILGLTATPPERNGKPAEDLKRYDEFFGPLDFHVPIPAVVKDGFLAPYQDLVQFVRPTPQELDFIGDANKQLVALVEELCAPQTGRESLTEWLTRVLSELRLPVGKASDWASFEKRDPELAHAGPVFLKLRGLPVPAGVPSKALPLDGGGSKTPPLPVLIPVLGRYIRQRLRGSPEPADQELAERAIGRLRLLGVQVTETGTQACASPISRVMAYARGKGQALLPILKAERKALGERIRAVVVTDFEKTSAISSEVSHLLNEEAGGAIAAYRVLVDDPETDALDPVLVTGSTLLVDDDLTEKFKEATLAWLGERRFDVEFDIQHAAGFTVFNGKGGDWCPRVYVALVTELFQRGLTKCLVGTRGLLGEGWDASKVNVLVDLTTVTTSTSVNQLRGRSMRLDPDDPEKLADNWDVICVAPEFVKGLDDYGRFLEKHNTLFGLTDDGVVEKGAGHVHAAFTEIEPEGIEDSMAVLNAEMLERPARRTAFRKLWRIGEPYRPEPVHALEVRPSGGMQGGFPPFGRTEAAWTTKSLTLAIAQAVLGALREAKLISGGRLHVGERAGGYVSAFLEDASDEDGRLFREALQEAMGPLDHPRYVIPRHVEYREDTWLSRVLPRIVGKYFQCKERRMSMLHALPSAVAKNKDLAAIYSRHWNTHVSPGEAVYAQADQGKQLIEKAERERALPAEGMHSKEVFL